MNKSSQIAINYAAGALLAALLLFIIWHQAKDKLDEIDVTQLIRSGNKPYLLLALGLLPLNIALESRKWHFLVRSAQPISYVKALRSVLGGIAIALLTPNRIGEYPGRIVYLKRQNTVRLISVSMLGAFAQFLNLFLFGLMALIWYSLHYPSWWAESILAAAILITIAIFFLFLRFEQWSAWLERIPWLRKLGTYSQLMRRFTLKEELTVLALTSARFVVYTAQYLALMRWMHINIPLFDGFMMASLFFWAMSVIPSVALAELGVRGTVSLFLFGHITGNAAGVLSATVVLWCINLIIPAIIGALLLLRIRILKDRSTA